MSNFISFSDFRTHVHDWDSENSDAMANTRTMKLLDDYSINFTGKSGEDCPLFGSAKMVDDYEVPVDDHAARQLAERLGIPFSWIANPDKCPPELRSLVHNWKFENQPPRDFLMRMHGKRYHLRAVLSDEYTPFDHATMIDTVTAAINHTSLDVKVVKPHIGNNLSAYIMVEGIRFDDPNSQRPMGDGGGSGGLYPAVYISNSEIGTGKARILGGLYRSYCENGMIVGWEVANKFSVTHRWSTPQHLQLLANEAIAQALQLSEDAAMGFLEAQAQAIRPSKLNEIVKGWSKKYTITTSKADQWLEALTAISDRGTVTYADAINEATHLANRTDNPDTVQELERMAGDMVMATPAPRYLRQ
jgi:hypothetical protein